MRQKTTQHHSLVLLFLLLVTVFIVAPVFSQESSRGGRERPPVDPFRFIAALLTTGANGNQLAMAMDIPAADLVTASIGTSDPAGTATSNSPLSFFPTAGGTFSILSTGLAASADDPDTNNAEALGSASFGDDVSAVLNGLTNSQGEDLVRLTLTLNPPIGATSLSFDFAFYSEEFPDWINSNFNDAFLAEIGAAPFTSGMTIVGNNISAPTNFALDPNGDVISVNAAFGFNPAVPNPNTGTTYDGTSGLLKATGCIPPNLPANGNIVLILSVTDLQDSELDSAVFLDNFQWGQAPNCSGGVKPVQKGTISVQKYQDTNNNGSRDTGEPGLNGWEIRVIDSQAQTIASGLTATVNGEDGVIVFPDIPVDTYGVCETQKAGWTNTDPSGGIPCKQVLVAPDTTTPVRFGNAVTPAGINIQKNPPEQIIRSGDNVTFTIVVKNTGQTALTNVVVSDPLTPACDNNIGNLPIGGEVSYSCTVNNVTSSFPNYAEVNAIPPVGPNIGDADIAVVLVINPVVTIDKSPDDQTIANGGDATFTITVTNGGDSVLTNVVVSDPLVPTCDRNIGTLNISGVVSYQCTASGVGTSFTNTATVTGTPLIGTNVSDDDTANVTVDSVTPDVCEPGGASYNPEGDLTGNLPSRTEGVVTNNSSVCSYVVGMAAYSRYDETLENQVLFSFDHPRVVGPGETIVLNVANPDSCAVQVDLFYGDLITDFAAQGPYGERLLSNRVSQELPYCQ